jgi:toxin YoeB
MSKRALHFDDSGWSDYLYWFTVDKKMVSKIHSLLEAIRRSPFDGLGKPEALRGNYSGLWSRRITDEHRLIYTVTDTEIQIAACRFHYDRRRT